jgi:hypothetical protein
MRRILYALALAWCSAASVSAQSATSSNTPNATRRTPVLVVLGTDAAAPYQLLVHPQGAVREVIVLPPSATPENLSEAVRAVMLSRAHGRTTTQSTLVRVASPGAATHRPLPWAGRVLNDLHKAPFQDVEGVGRTRTIRIFLPGRTK